MTISIVHSVGKPLFNIFLDLIIVVSFPEVRCFDFFPVLVSIMLKFAIFNRIWFQTVSVLTYVIFKEIEFEDIVTVQKTRNGIHYQLLFMNITSKCELEILWEESAVQWT